MVGRHRRVWIVDARTGDACPLSWPVPLARLVPLHPHRWRGPGFSAGSYARKQHRITVGGSDGLSIIELALQPPLLASPSARVVLSVDVPAASVCYTPEDDILVLAPAPHGDVLKLLGGDSGEEKVSSLLFCDATACSVTRVQNRRRPLEFPGTNGRTIITGGTAWPFLLDHAVFERAEFPHLCRFGLSMTCRCSLCATADGARPG